MDTLQYVICFFAAFLAGFIHGAIGLGHGMIAMAVMTLLLPYQASIAIVSSQLLCLVIVFTWSLRRSIDWHAMVVPSIAMSVGKILGIIFLMQIKSDYLRIGLGLFLLLYSISQLIGIKQLQIRGTPMQGALFCFAGGLVGGLFNVAGPLAAIYFQAVYPENVKKYAATMNFAFLPQAIIGPTIHLYYGNFRGEGVWFACLISSIAVMISIKLGMLVLHRINARLLRTFTYIFIAVMGAVICF